MLTAEFDYPLPSSAIAQRPAPRGEARLLVLDREGPDRHRRVRDLPAILQAGDLVVVNDTRVLPARLFGERRPGGGRVEILLVEKVGATEWEVLGRPGRGLRSGARVRFAAAGAGDGDGDGESDLELEVLSRSTADGRRRVRFDRPVEPLLDRLGHVPLPPYIRRGDEPADRDLYQTVFARAPGAVAAPTAGLHFDAAQIAALAARGIERAAITLHVGIGTFKPVTATLLHEHAMDAERFAVSLEAERAIRRARDEGRRVVAIGTTVVRCLESAALLAGGQVLAGEGRTDLFIRPGFPFQVVDVLLTNFHLPRSTLLVLVSAFAGRDRVLAAYREAIREGYRFYSYGDAMLVERRAAPWPG